MMSHTLFGTNAGDRIEAAGYPWMAYGENLLVGQGYPFLVPTQSVNLAVIRQAVDFMVVHWMKSPGHRENILDSRFDEVGHGFAASRDASPSCYYATEFGKR